MTEHYGGNPRLEVPEGAWFEITVIDKKRVGNFILWSAGKDEAVQELNAHLSTQIPRRFGDGASQDFPNNQNRIVILPSFAEHYGFDIESYKIEEPVDTVSDARSAIYEKINKPGNPELIDIMPRTDTSPSTNTL